MIKQREFYFDVIVVHRVNINCTAACNNKILLSSKGGSNAGIDDIIDIQITDFRFLHWIIWQKNFQSVKLNKLSTRILFCNCIIHLIILPSDAATKTVVDAVSEQKQIELILFGDSLLLNSFLKQIVLRIKETQNICTYLTLCRPLNYQQIWISAKHYFLRQPQNIFHLECRSLELPENPVEFPLYCLYLQ